MKLYLDAAQVERYIELHKKMKLPFQISISNYSTRITSNYCDIHFIRNNQSKRMFAAYTMLKNDVSGLVPPEVDKENLSYYGINFQNSFELKTVYNFDIKSAYASCLFVNKIISEKTFKYLNTLPKLDRLSAVGMLAGRKSIFQMNEDGNPVSEQTIVSPFENFFFFCVREVSEVMNFAASYMGNAYLFKWVDGIYFKPDEKEAAENYFKIMSKVFEDKGYKTSFEVLNNFKATSYKNVWKISFTKENKTKLFNIPKQELQLKKRIEKYLIGKDYSTIKKPRND